MSRPSTEHYDLTEVELVWKGKSRDVCTAILPFQTLEHINEPRSVGVSPASSSFQPALIDMSGRQTKDWANKLFLSSHISSARHRQLQPI